MNIENRALKKYGLRKGAYDGANRRRFVLFDWLGLDGVEIRHEFDTKSERDAVVRELVEQRRAER